MAMTAEQWQKLKEIFNVALERSGEARDAYVAEACALDSDLRAEVERLLAEYERESQGLSSGPVLVDAVQTLEDATRYAPSEILAGRYRIVRFIARGGMGEVYEAEDLELHEYVAIKTIRREILEGERVLELFKSEIQMARRVTHPNVCRIYDLVQHAEPESSGEQRSSFLTMELLQGQTLAECLRTSGPFTPDVALPLILQMARALQAAHEAGVIHRDFKPGNVILAPGKDDTLRAVVTDFGLALPMGAGSELIPVGRGTPHYMAPEQHAGGPITAATDVYALGLVIASMLGARRQSSKTSAIHELLHLKGFGTEDIEVTLPRSSARWSPILKRCLERDPLRRYACPADVAAALEESAKPSSNSAIQAIAAGFVLLLVTVLVIVFLVPTRISEHASARGTIRPVWTGDEVETSGRVSPDGRLLSFIDWSTGDLGIRNVATGEMRRVTRNPKKWPAGAGASHFSPDSRSLVYDWREEDARELRIIGTDGSGMRTLFRVESAKQSLLAADWSPEGKKVLAIYSPRASQVELLVISTEDAKVRNIPCAGSFRYDVQALISPNGRFIAYDAVDPSGSTIRIIELATLEDSVLIKGSPRSRLFGWSPDGSRLVYVSDRSGVPGLWALRIGHGKAQGDPELLKNDTAGWISPGGVTRQGTLYYSVPANLSEVYLAEIDAHSGLVTSSPNPLGQRFVGSKSSLLWSPDGSGIVYAISRHGMPTSDMALLSLPDGTEREVHPKVSSLFLLHKWHPNSRTVFAEGVTSAGQSGLLSVNVATGEAELVATGLPNDRPGFSTDASTIYFMRRQQDLVARDLQSGAERILYTTNVPHALRNPNVEISPDGQKLVFQLQGVPEGEDSIAVMPVTGAGGPRILLSIRNERVLGRGLIWTSDSRNILAARMRDNRSSVWKIPADGGPAQEIGLSMAGLVRMLRLNPDGRRLAFLNGENKEEIFAIETLLPAVRPN